MYNETIMNCDQAHFKQKAHTTSEMTMALDDAAAPTGASKGSLQ
jgi:hypothetical protein